MESLVKHKGIVALLDRGNIDTDQIIPKQFLKSIKKTGYGESLFFDWRYHEDGSDNPTFELNQEKFSGATILVAGNNFGCGSSREHAVWAVAQYGFRVIIAPRVEREGSVIPGFADIFRNNCIKNGILPIELDQKQVDAIKEALKLQQRLGATIDLEEQKILLHTMPDSPESGHMILFEIDDSAKERLTKGLDDIGLTLEKNTAIESFEQKHNAQMFS